MIFSIGDTDNLSTDTVTNVSGNDYTATYTVESGQNGSVSYSISSYTDSFGNSGGLISNSSSITVDTEPPTLTTVALQSDNTDTTKAIIGNTITLSFTSSETLQANPTVTFSIGNTNDLVTTVTNVSGNNYTATYIVQSGQNGLVSYSISSYTDILGNNGNLISNSSSITVDATPIILANSQVIGITHDNTPIYKFTSNKVGTLTYISNNNLSLSNNGLTNNSTVSNGVNTIEFNTINNNANYSGEQITVTDNSGNTTNLIIPDFVVHVGTYPSHRYLAGYSNYGPDRFVDFQEAVDEMEQTSDAGGITYNILGDYYTLRLGTILYNSPKNEISWLKSELMGLIHPPPTGDVSLGYIYNYNSHHYSYGVGTLTFDAF